MARIGLTAFGNEFLNPVQERAFLSDRLRESRRHSALLLAMSAALHLLFLLVDLRLLGTEAFFTLIPIRVVVMTVSLIGGLVVLGINTAETLRRALLGWQVMTTLAVLPLLSGQADNDLITIFMVPAIFYLLVPAGFRASVAVGVGSSVVLLCGHLWQVPWRAETPELALAMVALNILLILHMAWYNRNRRQEWAAVQAERQANGDLESSRTMTENMFMAVPVPLVVTRLADGRILRLNDAARHFFGGEPAAFGVHNIQQLYMVPEQREEMAREVQHRGHVNGMEASIMVSDGSQREVLVSASALEVNGEPAMISGTVDITTRKALERHLAFLATSDPLTGLANRHRFFSTAQRELHRATRHGHETAVLLADVDHFKRINDTYGHEAGDIALTSFAEVLQAHLRGEDLLARLGGEEFAVLLPETNIDNAVAVAERLRMATQALRIDKDGDKISVTVSIGVARVRPDDGNIDTALSRADRAMYCAKRLGRNRVVKETADEKTGEEGTEEAV